MRVSKIVSFSYKGITFVLSLVLALTIAAPATAQQVRKAPDFETRDLEGREIVYSQQLSECGVLLFFFDPDCGSCHALMAKLAEVYPTFRDQGVVFIGVPLTEEMDKVRGFANQYGNPFSIVAEQQIEIARKYGTWVTAPKSHPEYQKLLREGKITEKVSLVIPFATSVVLISPKGTISLGPEQWFVQSDGRIDRRRIDTKKAITRPVLRAPRTIPDAIKLIAGSKRCSTTLP